eukprot:s1653_g8.t1
MCLTSRRFPHCPNCPVSGSGKSSDCLLVKNVGPRDPLAGEQSATCGGGATASVDREATVEPERRASPSPRPWCCGIFLGGEPAKTGWKSTRVAAPWVQAECAPGLKGRSGPQLFAMDVDDVQVSLLQSGWQVSSNEVLGSQLLSTGWKALGMIPAHVQNDIHAMVPLLVLVLFMLVLWIFLLILNQIPPEWYSAGRGDEKGASSRSERMTEEAQSTPVDGSPVCASLTFPRSEARFKIFGDRFRNGKNLEILGESSGRPILVAAIGMTKEGLNTLRISFPNCETDPRCSIQVAPEAIGYDAFVFARKEELYGTLEKSSGCCLVRHHEVLALKAEVNRITLAALVTSAQGRQLAKGGMEMDGFWHLQVEPKADALLILATILAAVRLWRPQPSEGRLPRPAPGTVGAARSTSPTWPCRGAASGSG